MKKKLTEKPKIRRRCNQRLAGAVEKSDLDPRPKQLVAMLPKQHEFVVRWLKFLPRAKTKSMLTLLDRHGVAHEQYADAVTSSLDAGVPLEVMKFVIATVDESWEQAEAIAFCVGYDLDVWCHEWSEWRLLHDPSEVISGR